MSDYIGFFVRDQLGQVPNQTGSSWSTSPDIIFAGAAPPVDASQYTTPAGYDTDFGSTVYAGAPPTANFVYLRALNTNPAVPVTGRAWFYWVESDLALWPQNWNSSAITVAGQPVNYQDIVATADNQVCMPNLPYIWTPPPPSPGQHFCGISWMENTPSNPPVSPVTSMPQLLTFDDLVNFILSHPSMGWRNVMNVAGLGYTWTQTTNITGPATPQPFYIGVQCSNMPTDGQVGFQVPGPNPGIPSVVVPMTPIATPNMLLMSMVSDWPGGAVSSITVDYKQGATTPPPGASVTVTLTVAVDSLSDDTRALVATAPPHLVVEPAHGSLQGATEGAIQPTRLVVLGSMTYRW